MEESKTEKQQPLSSTQRKELRGKAHALKPVVQIGKERITAGLIEEINQALFHHELIKVKFVEGKDEKAELAAEIAEQSGAAVVGIIGNIAILYRRAAKLDLNKSQLL